MRHADLRGRADRRHGFVLLEVIVALALLAIGAVAVVALAGQSLQAVARAEDADRASARASAFLDAVALWPRADLDRHLGEREDGAWRLQVERPLPTLYTIVLRDTTGAVLLATSLYRAEAPRAAP